MKSGLSVVMSAHDEAQHLPGVVASVTGIADEIIVVDSASEDDTSAVAASLGARVTRQPNHLMLNINKNLAMSMAEHEWTLLLDPDERVSTELRAEIRALLDHAAPANSTPAAFYIPRLNRELGAVIRTMGHYPDLQLRLFRTGTVEFACENIHESVVVTGATGHLSGELDHFPKQRLFDYVHKRNLYSEHRAAHVHANGGEFRLRRLILRPLTVFLKNYVLRSGWRDRIPGFIIAVTSAYGTFLQDAKLWQLENGPTDPPAPGEDP